MRKQEKFIFWAFAAALLHSPLAHGAATTGQYLWSDLKGFQPAASCQISLQQQIPFVISAQADANLNGSEALKSTQGITRAAIPDRSLLELLNSSASSLTAVQVISVPTNARLQNLKSPAVRADQGLMDGKALQEIDGYVVEISSSGSQKIRSFQDKELSVQKTYWQVAMQGDRYVTMNCEGQKQAAIAFNVFTSDSLQPVATVGVPLSDTGILKATRIYTAEEAERLLNGEDTEGASTPTADKTANTATAGTTAKFTNGGLTRTYQENLNAKQDIAASTTRSSTPGSTTSAVTPGGTTASGLIPVPQTRPDLPATATVSGVPEVSGSLDYLVCTQSGGLSVRDESLKKVLFSADQFEEVKPVQSWDGQSNKDYVQVQFPKRSNKTGWVARRYVELKSKCSSYKETPAQPAVSSAKVSGIDDAACCVFPTKERPTVSYKTGMRRFRYPRSKGRRLHAACDLYRNRGDAAVAVTNGTVIRDRYYFYQGVYAIEVKHSGGFVARYGEILGKAAAGVRKGASVKPGQTVGYIGKVNSGCCSPMLHFELYSGKAKGALSQLRSRPFQRRSDLLDPTDYLSKWEKARFGKAY